MAKSAAEKTINDLSRQLEREKTEHAVTKNKLQAEIERVWRLVPGYKINLMGAFPPLKKLLHVLAEAADLQDPSRGAAYEDTARVDFVPDEYRIMSSTERAVLTHRKHRDAVAQMNKELDWVTHKLSKLNATTEVEYDPPEGECEECGKLLFQNDTGRRKSFCSTKCRVRASRKERV